MPGGYGVGATDAWSVTTGEGVTVAVLDTGVLPDHPDLAGQLLPVRVMGRCGGDVMAEAGIASLSNMGEWGPTEDAWAYTEGTSQAAPHVSATIALLKALDPALIGDDLLAVMQATATPLTACDRDGCGGGIVNAAATVAHVSGQPVGEQPRPAAGSWYTSQPKPDATPSPAGRVPQR